PKNNHDSVKSSRLYKSHTGLYNGFGKVSSNLELKFNNKDSEILL
ncbi:869_t:CDS:1, partial [Gigaspora rosea]